MGKEILIALRKRVSVEEFFRKNRVELARAEVEVEDEQIAEQGKITFNGDIKEEARKKYSGIKGTRMALLLDGNMDIIKKVSSREVSRNIRFSKQKVFAVVIDGSALGAIIGACDESGVSYLAATNFSSFDNAKVNLISL